VELQHQKNALRLRGEEEWERWTSGRSEQADYLAMGSKVLEQGSQEGHLAGDDRQQKFCERWDRADEMQGGSTELHKSSQQLQGESPQRSY